MTPTKDMVAMAERIADEVANKAYYGDCNSPLREAALTAIMETSEKAAGLAIEQQKVFGSTQYATGQPLSSFGERFACGRIAEAIRNGEHLK